MTMKEQKNIFLMEAIMTEKEKALKGLLYDANYDENLLNERSICKDKCFEYNNLKPSQINEQKSLMKNLLGKMGKEFFITAPFWCDYGYNIEIGENFYTNHNCVILDGATVSFGDNVFIAPNCCFSTAGHPIDYERRNKGLEYAYPIKVGNNVWFGANVTVLPGVTIGNNVVVGSGSVVNKDIPSDVVAAGNPCKIIREITEEDKKKYIVKEQNKKL
jgi:acetyltransferase-like isoleucine patch superfamily enzyme